MINPVKLFTFICNKFAAVYNYYSLIQINNRFSHDVVSSSFSSFLYFELAFVFRFIMFIVEL